MPEHANAQLALAAAIGEVARELRRTVPAPRTAPYFMLDSDLPYDPVVLDGLSSPGIFRKYELVLLIRSGLGGTARWLSKRLGCRVLGIDPDASRIQAANLLNGLARMSEDVSFSAAQSERLPFRDRVFTHVWIINPTPEDRTAKALAEAFRVLRSGAHFALQTTIEDEHTVARIGEQLAAAGFIDMSTRTDTLLPRNQTTTLARARLRATLAGESARLWRDDVVARPTPCAQIFARRA